MEHIMSFIAKLTTSLLTELQTRLFVDYSINIVAGFLFDFPSS